MPGSFSLSSRWTSVCRWNLQQCPYPFSFNRNPMGRKNLIWEKTGVEGPYYWLTFLNRSPHQSDWQYSKLSAHSFKSGCVWLLLALDASNNQLFCLQGTSFSPQGTHKSEWPGDIYRLKRFHWLKLTATFLVILLFLKTLSSDFPVLRCSCHKGPTP